MRHTPVIRSILALQFMLLLVLGITPKKGLHDAFARHQHVTNNINSGELQVQQGEFYCDIHDFVAESPFTPTEASVTSTVSAAFYSNFATIQASPVQKLAIAKDNKGPPATAF